MPVGKSTGHRQSALASITVDGGPLRENWDGRIGSFALVLVDYVTRYPEAVPLRSISAKSVAEALFRIISRVGIPKEILTDQGTAFMSRTLTELYGLLGIKSIREKSRRRNTHEEETAPAVFPFSFDVYFCY